MFTKVLSKEREKPLRIVVSTPFRGPGNLPAIHATPEAQGRITGYVEFDSSEDIKGGNMELYFRIKSEARWARHYGESTVVYHNKEVLQKETWNFDLARTPSGLVAAGKSKFDFDVMLEPHTPSSIKGQRGWLNYRLRLTLHRTFPRRNIEVVQDVWTFSTEMPAPGRTFLPLEPSVCTGIWEEHLPFAVSYPGNAIMLGQNLPLTIKFEPFLKTSGHIGQDLIILDCVIKLKQYTKLWHRWDTKNETKEIFAIPVNEGWPVGPDGFERTIDIPIPPAPRLSCTTYTRVVRKTHTLKVIMHVRTNANSAKESKELRIETNVTLTGPRPSTDLLPEDLPPYSLRQAALKFAVATFVMQGDTIETMAFNGQLLEHVKPIEGDLNMSTNE
ncbi:hypothetical protein BG004_005359 [Podila humilis]|nr:hypothetical protein BG004_005359 [Podila humilis]